MDDLLNYQCVDFKKLLILKAKELKISDQECYLLLLIMAMDEVGMKPITPSHIKQLCSLPLSKIDEILIALVDKHFVQRFRGSLDLKPIQLMLLNQESEEEKSVDLLSVFENTFGRSLNQMEIEIIQSFKGLGYDDQMILDALNEAVKSGVMNFRYIEKILDNWAKQGVKRRFASKAPIKQENVEQRIKDYQWWLNED